MRPSGGNTHLAETAIFLAALEEFDFENADFLDDSLMDVQELLEDYDPLVEGLYDRLEISRLDPFLEAVELEINRLYLD